MNKRIQVAQCRNAFTPKKLPNANPGTSRFFDDTRRPSPEHHLSGCLRFDHRRAKMHAAAKSSDANGRATPFRPPLSAAEIIYYCGGSDRKSKYIFIGCWVQTSVAPSRRRVASPLLNNNCATGKRFPKCRTDKEDNGRAVINIRKSRALRKSAGARSSAKAG